MTAHPLPEFLRTRQGLAWVLAIVALITVVQYLPTLRFDFVWDDTQLITDNRLLPTTSPLAIFGRSFWAGSPEPAQGSAQAYYRPLTTLSFWLDMAIAGRSPWFFHMVNVLLAAAVSVLVTLLVWELLHSGVWAALGGMLFACHPSHVEAVAFISARTDLLVTFFTVVAGFSLLRSLRKHNPRWWIAVLAGYALALFSKETALLFPVLIVLAPVMCRTRYPRFYWLLFLGSLAIAGSYLLIRHLVLGTAIGPTFEVLRLHQIINIANTFGLYIRMFLWPFTHQAKFPLDPSFRHLSPHTAYALVFLVSIPLAALRRRFWIALWGYVWVICFLLPVINIVPIGPQAAERLLFLPSAGLTLIATILLSRSLASRHWLRRIVAAALSIVAVVFAADTLARSRVWRSNLTLFAAMAREAPRAPSAYAGLAQAIAAADPDSAIRLYNRALYYDQGYLPAHINLGILYGKMGDYRRAVHQLRLADLLRPNSATICHNLGLAWLGAAELDSALAAFNRAISLEPAAAQHYLGRSLTLCFLGRTSEAELDLLAAISRDPALLTELQAFARALCKQPELRLGSPLGTNRLGTLLAIAGDTALAETCYLRALELDSTWVPALFNEAVLRAIRGDTATARILASRALKLRPDLPSLRELYGVLSQHPPRQ
ncbi:MAG: glycosyltransferase family 39 protein [candidate division WOR-3 bacterium]